MKKITTLLSAANQEKLKCEYINAHQNKAFAAYVDQLDVNDDVLMQYTSRLEDVVEEQERCKNCPGLGECQNILKGHVLSAIKTKEGLLFSYVACPYFQKREKQLAYQQNITCYDLPKEIREASFKNIYKDDKNRTPIILYFKEFIDGYLTKKNPKGIYLHGSFGSGKTYLIAALFNELAKRDIVSALVYYPELLRSLKSSFHSNYEERFEFLKRVPLLLLDDIGAENVTTWSRDEVLGPLLQFRMEEHLPTFFTSNLTLSELEKVLAGSNSGAEQVKAKRIVERIKQLTVDMELISKNRRH